MSHKGEKVTLTSKDIGTINAADLVSGKPVTPKPEKYCLRGHSTRPWVGSSCRCFDHTDGTYGCIPKEVEVGRGPYKRTLLVCPKCKHAEEKK